MEEKQLPMGTMEYQPGSIAVGLSQRKEKAHIRTGLQPHLNMRLKPEELFCSSVNRPLKQTAIEEKQTAMEEKQLPISNKVSRTARNTRHVAKTRDKPAAVYKPIGKMSERFGNTGPPPGRTGPNARKYTRQVWQYDSGGGKYPLGERKHPFGDWKYPFGDWNDSLGDWNDSLGDWNDSLWYGNDPVKNWMDAGPPGRLPVSVWIPNPEGLGNFQGLKSMAEEWEWFVQKIPEGLHVYSNGTQMYHSTPCGVALFFASGYFYKHLIPLESCDGTEDHTRLGTELHNCYGTGLGSRNTVASQPVHPPEWERYGRKRTEHRVQKAEQ
jgi:hypothetical protein